MPYVIEEARKDVDDLLIELVDRMCKSGALPGLITYVFTTLLARLIRKHGLSRAVMASAIGVLETTKLELYRRLAVPYENAKMVENGDIDWDSKL